MDDVYYQCSNCGAKFNSPVGKCTSCGVNLTLYTGSGVVRKSKLEAALDAALDRKINRYMEKWTFYGKSKGVALILWWFFAFFQAHLFYLGFYKMAVVKLLTTIAALSGVIVLYPIIEESEVYGLLIFFFSIYLIIIMISLFFDLFRIICGEYHSKNVL
jgi:DNA-directed RNA polymerase subunit RPC12/RpoP